MDDVIERVDIFKSSDKIKRIIKSCKSKEHFDSAKKMIQNFHRVYEDIPEESDCTNSLYQFLSKYK